MVVAIVSNFPTARPAGFSLSDNIFSWQFYDTSLYLPLSPSHSYPWMQTRSYRKDNRFREIWPSLKSSFLATRRYITLSFPKLLGKRDVNDLSMWAELSLENNLQYVDTYRGNVWEVTELINAHVHYENLRRGIPQYVFVCILGETMSAEVHVSTASQTAYISLTNKTSNKQRMGWISSMHLAQTIENAKQSRERKRARERVTIMLSRERLNERECLPICTSVASTDLELQRLQRSMVLTTTNLLGHLQHHCLTKLMHSPSFRLFQVPQIFESAAPKIPSYSSTQPHSWNWIALVPTKTLHQPE